MEKNQHILIIDDSFSIRSNLKTELENHGYTVTEALDGQEGFEVAQSEEFDLIITDINMPRLNGFDLCERLKECPATQSIPVIILSSLDSDVDIERGFKTGAAAFVTKANAKHELHERIDEVLRRSSLIRERLILVVDDSPVIRNIVTDGLTKAGFNVITAQNGLKALSILKDETPDLILSDIQMPQMDGMSFCSAVKSNPKWCSIPFVVMSSASDRAVIRRMIDRGACGFLVKPFNVEQLIVTTEKLLSDHFQLILKEKERLDIERDLIIASITSLVHALEARDQYTRGHSEMVAQLAVGIAESMGFSDEELETVYMAGRLHDIGKIGIRDDVLLKPGPLTDSEFSQIKQHPVIGAEILGPIPSMAPIIPGVLHHHEHISGKGYPDGLKGDKIPLLPRIISVADTYDALTSNRPYKTKSPKDIALQIIVDVKGTQLCPECVDSFLGWIQ